MAIPTFFRLTVRRKSPNAGSDLAIPQRKTFPISILTNAPERNTKRGGSVVKLTDSSFRGSRKFEVYETPDQIVTASDPLSTNNSLDALLTVAGNGHTIASTTVIANYYNKINAATSTSADAIRLAAVASKQVCVLWNSTAVPILVFPNAAGEAIVDSTGTQGANGASITLAAGATIHVISDGIVNRVAVDA